MDRNSKTWDRAFLHGYPAGTSPSGRSCHEDESASRSGRVYDAGVGPWQITKSYPHTRPVKRIYEVEQPQPAFSPLFVLTPSSVLGACVSLVIACGGHSYAYSA
jgi:hypothetical protein